MPNRTQRVVYHLDGGTTVHFYLSQCSASVVLPNRVVRVGRVPGHSDPMAAKCVELARERDREHTGARNEELFCQWMEG